MTVQYAEAVVTASHVVHDEVWFRHWREGQLELRPNLVIDAIRQVRVKARINEDELPQELYVLLQAARSARGEHDTVPLSELITALKTVFLPPADES